MKDPWKKLLANVKISGRRGHERELKELKGSRTRYSIEVTSEDSTNQD